MKISNIQKKLVNEKVVLQALITHKNKTEKLYFSYNKDVADFVVDDGTPFVAAAIIPCLLSGEDLIVEGCVSKEFLANLELIKKLWLGWSDKLKIKVYDFKMLSLNVKPDKFRASHNSLFFSAGVDSFYTYLKNKDIGFSYFIFVHGFDISLKDNQLFSKILPKVQSVSNRLGVELIEGETNVRSFLDQYMEWDYTHGAAMASVALALRSGLKSIFYSGAIPWAYMRPYGMHPHLDHLWSTETIKFIHEGTQIDRLDRVVKYIAKSKIALETLRVCWKNVGDSYNCCECEKCLRTMLDLYAAGVLKQAKTFPKPINNRLLRNLYLLPNQVRYFQECLDLLISKNNPADTELINAVRLCIDQNKNRKSLRKYIYIVRRKLSQFDHKYIHGRIYEFLSKKDWI